MLGKLSSEGETVSRAGNFGKLCTECMLEYIEDLNTTSTAMPIMSPRKTLLRKPAATKHPAAGLYSRL